MKHMIIKLLYACIIGYLVLCVLVFVLGNKLTFPAPKPSYSDSKQIIKLALPDGNEISALFFRNPSSKYTILYSHGSREDLGRIKDRLKAYQEKGYSIFAYDYPGYGTSEGKPNEENINDSIFQAYNYLTKSLKIPPQQILVYGRSLGAGPSLELASNHPVGGVILEGAFMSAFRTPVYYPIMLWDIYKNHHKIGRINAPLLVIHGKSDRLVPFSHGKSLYQKASQPKENYWIEGAGHNNILKVSGTQYWKRLSQFTRTLNK